MESYLFRFEFSSRYNNFKNMNYVVFAENEEDLKMFLIQHNFIDSPMDAVTIVSKEEAGNCYASTLCKHLFRSNHSNELFTVMTCPDFVDKAIETTCNSLNDAMLFGEAIVRRDVEIFKMIGELIHKLPHANVLDFIFADTESTKDPDDIIDESIALDIDYKNRFSNGISWIDDPSTYYVHQSMDNFRHEGGPEPITIEAYVSYFTEMMVDVFE